MSSMVSPVLARIFSVAGMTPVSMSSGSLPVTAKAWNRARGVSPNAFARSSLMIRSALAPSVIWDELPAVMLHEICGKRACISSLSKEHFSAASDSTELLGRMVSSASTTRVPPSSVGTVIGTISLANPPASAVAWARRCERTEYSSRSSRLRPHLAATSSAEMPWGTTPGA